MLYEVITILDIVNAGQYEMGHSASYYWKGKDPSTMPFTTMPFGMIAPEQYAWFYYGGGMELMKKVYAKHGVYSFPGGNTGNQMGGWFRNRITSYNVCYTKLLRPEKRQAFLVPLDRLGQFDPQLGRQRRGTAGKAAQRRADEQLEGGGGRRRVARQAEHRLAGDSYNFV